ncbi:uncharacterized protein LOC121406105 [Lytechinus variegatus]|uniref:uncharacterized protein LOC121406105 n=1 Tax=Lytechinus variegatus TaxID=7654 RepID=UPI001BB21BCD|nr:uncharacterized protein LOC121406105 [Lytechinus variegatus]
MGNEQLPSPLTANILNGLESLQFISISDYRICCLLKDAVNAKCIKTSSPGPNESCGKLLPGRTLTILAWILSSSALTGNAAVILLRLIDNKLKVAEVTNRFLIGQAVADLFMGIYMVLITSADVQNGKDHFLIADVWPKSGRCSIARLIGWVANEASAITIVLSTIERLICTASPRGRVTFIASGLMLAMCWLWTMVTSVLITVISENTDKRFGLAQFCIPVFFHSKPQDTGSLTITRSYNGSVLGSSYKLEDTDMPYVPITSTVYMLLVWNLLSSLITDISNVVMLVRKWRSIQSGNAESDIGLDNIPGTSPSTIADPTPCIAPQDEHADATDQDTIDFTLPGAKSDDKGDTNQDSGSSVGLTSRTPSNSQAKLDSQLDFDTATGTKPATIPSPRLPTLPSASANNTPTSVIDTPFAIPLIPITASDNTEISASETPMTASPTTVTASVPGYPRSDGPASNLSSRSSIPTAASTSPDFILDSPSKSEPGHPSEPFADDVPKVDERHLLHRATFRISFLILMDIFSWLPVLFAGFGYQTGVPPTSLFSWAVMFLITVKAVLNPFLFTFLFYLEDRKNEGNALIVALRMPRDPNAIPSIEVDEAEEEELGVMDQTIALTFGII